MWGVGSLVAAGSEETSLLESTVLSIGVELLDVLSPAQAANELIIHRTSNKAVIFFIWVIPFCFLRVPFHLSTARAAVSGCKFSINGKRQFVKCLFCWQPMLKKHEHGCAIFTRPSASDYCSMILCSYAKRGSVGSPCFVQAW